jgi:hypothetical protein
MVHDSASYKVLYLFLALLAGDVECRVHVLSGGVHSSAMLEKEHHNVDVTQPRGNVERCLLLLKQKLLQQIVLTYTSAVISPFMHFNFKVVEEYGPLLYLHCSNSNRNVVT